MTEINRRHALYLAGAGMAAAAGCAESTDDSDADGDSSEPDDADDAGASTEREDDDSDPSDDADEYTGSIEAGESTPTGRTVASSASQTRCSPFPTRIRAIRRSIRPRQYVG